MKQVSYSSARSRSIFVSESIVQTPQTGEKIKMYVTTWCGDCRFAKRWFDAHNIPYEAIDIEKDENAAELVKRVNGGRQSVPTIIFPDGSVLVEPGARELMAKFSL
jgi:mycoredoxin